jgi:hypothetical protein
MKILINISLGRLRIAWKNWGSVLLFFEGKNTILRDLNDEETFE